MLLIQLFYPFPSIFVITKDMISEKIGYEFLKKV